MGRLASCVGDKAYGDEHAECKAALIRAHHLIGAMVPYVGKMALPAEFFGDWNEHEMHMSQYGKTVLKGSYKELFKVHAGMSDFADPMPRKRSRR